MLSRFVLLVCLALQAYATSPVVHITYDTFKDFIAGHDTVLVNFCTQSSRHCKKLEPTFEQAAEFLTHQEPDIALARVVQ